MHKGLFNKVTDGIVHVYCGGNIGASPIENLIPEAIQLI